MYHEFYQAPATSYYGPGRGYEEKDVVEALDSVTGSDFAPFFERYVSGTDALPYQETLAMGGLQLRTETPPDAAPSLGVVGSTRNPGDADRFDYSRRCGRPGRTQPR